MNFIETRNPATGELIQQYETQNTNQIDSTVHAMQHSFISWSNSSLATRSDLLRKVAILLRQHQHEYAKLIATEMGKPIIAGQKEIVKCAWACDFYADQAANFLAPKIVNTDFHKSYVCYQPLGTIFAIMPWNYPFWQVFRFAAPNLMAGNTILLNHAPITTGCGNAIEQLLLEAGFPENVLRHVVITHKTAEFIIEHAHIKGVTLTGSPNAGRAVAQHAGKALKKVVLELGGNDPYLILADADLKQAAQVCVQSRLANTGQVCIAAKRIIVDQSVYAEFEQLVLEQVKHYRMGNPLDDTTTLGPLARADLRNTVHNQVQKNIKQGAKLIIGGEIPKTPGFFYPPTVLSQVTENMLAMQEEIFGPVVTLIPADNEDHAISLANNNAYGLAGAIFTRDIARGEKIAAEKILAGTCNVNSLVASDPRLPFGGIKESGFGRELGKEGMHEFMNIKTICVKS